MEISQESIDRNDFLHFCVREMKNSGLPVFGGAELLCLFHLLQGHRGARFKVFQPELSPIDVASEGRALSLEHRRAHTS